MSESVTIRKKRSFGYKIKKFTDIYLSTDEYLGEGSCGTVRTFYNVEKEKEFAVKIVESSSKRVRKKVLKEIEILHHCKGHPNITQLHEFYEEDQKFYLVFEKMAGLTLLDWMERHGGRMREEEVAEVTRGLATALDFLHHKGVAHRDLKLENVLCTSLDHIHPVKICDFDLSTDFGGKCGEGGGVSGGGGGVSAGGGGVNGSPGYGSGSEASPPMEHFNLSDLASAVGSADYMAPEVVRVWLNEDSHYSEQCDIWSLGVVLYILLCGYKPFGGMRSSLCCCSSTQTTLQCDYCKEEHFEQIKEGVVELSGVMWEAVSEGAKHLVSRLLVKDPVKRLTASQVLSHPWVQDAGVFTHAKSSPIPCMPLRTQRNSEDWHDNSAEYTGNNNNNNTLVEESQALADHRIFSLELDDDTAAGVVDSDVGGGASDDYKGAAADAAISADSSIGSSGGSGNSGGVDVDEAVVEGCVAESDGGVVEGEDGGGGGGGKEKGSAIQGGVQVNSTGGGVNEAVVVHEARKQQPQENPDERASSSGGRQVALKDDGCIEKVLLCGSCDSGNHSGISLVGSPCVTLLVHPLAALGIDPGKHPGNHPSDLPSNHPSNHPSNNPSDHASNHPSNDPNNHPSDHASKQQQSVQDCGGMHQDGKMLDGAAEESGCVLSTSPPDDDSASLVVAAAAVVEDGVARGMLADAGACKVAPPGKEEERTPFKKKKNNLINQHYKPSCPSNNYNNNYNTGNGNCNNRYNNINNNTHFYNYQGSNNNACKFKNYNANYYPNPFEHANNYPKPQPKNNQHHFNKQYNYQNRNNNNNNNFNYEAFSFNHSPNYTRKYNTNNNYNNDALNNTNNKNNRYYNNNNKHKRVVDLLM